MKLMFLKRLRVVLYKNLLLRSTQWFVSTMEVFLPILFVWLVGYGAPRQDCVRVAGTGGGYSTSGKVVSLDPRWCRRKSNISISYTPTNTETTDVVNILGQHCTGVKFNPKIDTEELQDSFMDKNDIGLVFPDGLAPLQGSTGTIKNSVISYTIRMNVSEVPSTEKLLPPQKLGEGDYAHVGERGLLYSMIFLNLQRSLDKVLVEKITGTKFDYEIRLEQFNYPKIDSDKHFGSNELGAFTFTILFSFSVLFIIPTITRNLVAEKQTGIGELMKSAGVSGWIQWMGWMINSLVPMLFTISICTFLLFSRIGNKRICEHEALMVFSDWSLIWFILLLYITSTIAFCFFICSLLKKPTIATTIAILISVISTFLFLAPVHKLLACVFPNCAITYAYLIILQAERSVLDDSDQPFGAQWNYEGLSYLFPEDSWMLVNINELSLFQIIMMLVGDIVGYFLLALYFENVLPSEHGVRRPWYLFNFREYLQSKKRKHVQVSPAIQQHPKSEVGPLADANNQNYPQKEGGVEGKSDTDTSTAKKKGSSTTANKPNTGFYSSFEPEVARDAAVGIEIQNIFKNFGRKRAVNGISLRMYAGDIFALLGHNGAGKTTLISMLTGFFSPSNGTAFVNGHDIRFGLSEARERMGLCPQHNMLFDNISVKNHLIIFGMLRGLTLRQAKNEGLSLLLKMNLSDKKSTLARKLSGGQKRKLSLGMALIGGTKVVVLDEPTSGMDPQARREIWDLLLELRQGRTILLTTHFMEEADVLGDRIGIMAAGRLQCCGTTAFLKKYYGAGYTLKLTLQQQQDPSKISIASNPPATKILAAIQKHIPDASVKKDARSDANSNEIFITLPGETATTTALTQMFTDVNSNKDRLGIQTIGLQQTTMDEVFLRVGELSNEEQHSAQKYDWTEDSFEKVPKMKGPTRYVWQFVSLLVKKWIFFKRKWILLLLEILIPVLLIVGATFTIQIYAEKDAKEDKSLSSYSSYGNARTNTEDFPGPAPQPELLISLDKYPSPITYYSPHESGWDSYFAQVIGSSKEKFDGDPSKLQEKLVEIGTNDRRKYKRRMIIAAKSDPTSITGLFNSYPYHSAPLALNVASNIALRALDPSANNKIQVTNHPWVPSANKARSSEARQQYPGPNLPDRTGSPPERNMCPNILIGNPVDIYVFHLTVYGSATLFLLAFILLNCTYVVIPIEEKICNVKQLQLMTGLQPASYWMANFVWDYIVYLMVVIGAIFMILIIENSSGYLFLSISQGTGVLFFILMCYGFSSIVLAYLLSRRSTSVAGGFALVVLIHLLTGIIFGFPVLVWDKLSWQNGSLFRFIVVTFKVIGYCFPSMPALVALARYLYIAGLNAKCYQMDEKLPPAYRNTKYLSYVLWSTAEELDTRSTNPYDQGTDTYYESGVGQEVFIIVLLGVIYVVLLMVFEYGLLNKICRGGAPPPFPPNIYDDDVYQEAERVNFLVQSGEVKTECMVIQNLSKAFGGFAAVSQVNFAVHYGECFGLLGVNGAGKTTMFKMITGEEIPSLGSVYGFGSSTVQSPRFFFSNIGYCPQFDAIIGIFTGREMLELFGVLKGIPLSASKKESLKWLQRFGLSDSANVPCGRYSGGMKRRLSTAIAMIGDPGLILLDEPTSGVDPVSRHQFWGILEKIRDSGQSIILTSHSMDECEALCSRLGIMVNGQFQCFGGVQHLKTKFAQGYSLTIKLKSDLPFGTEEFEKKMKNFEGIVNEKFKPCVLKDKHQNLLQYHLQNPSITWDALFKTMESIKKEFEDMIEDYSVNETSLEEVFLAFARMQYPERQVGVTTCRQICTCSC